MSSSSDDEAPINVVGNIPLEWYDEFDHIGYKANGDKLIPKERPDKLDDIIRRTTDPNWWRRYYDKRSGEYKTITDEDLDLVARIRQGHVAIRNYQMYQPFNESENPDKIHPLTNKMEPKSRFQPSKSTLYKVSQIVAAIRRGEMQEKEETEEEAVDIWTQEEQIKPRIGLGHRAPKPQLPTTDESYHPPDDEDPHKRLLDVEGYQKAIKERCDRLSDLYLCPREMQAKLPETSAEVLPEIPDIEELKPFPTTEAVRYVGHTGRVFSVSPNFDGSLIASGSADGTVRIWETLTGRCLHTFDLSEEIKKNSPSESVIPVNCVAFSPSSDTTLVAACCGKYIFIIKPSEPEQLLTPLTQESIVLMRKVAFSKKGQYMAVTADKHHVFVYNTESWECHAPFRAPPGTHIMGVLFHPTKPQMIVATQKHIYIYDVSEKTQKVDTLRPMAQWISSIDVHPRGNHIIAGSYDGRSFWFDVEVKNTPFKVLREHTSEKGIVAVRDVAYHKLFPLFATAHDDGRVDVYHGKVFNDLVTCPLIVPVKELNGHEHSEGLSGALCAVWHPRQPWLITSGADHTIRLWT